jgi:hypothetical protein
MKLRPRGPGPYRGTAGAGPAADVFSEIPFAGRVTVRIEARLFSVIQCSPGNSAAFITAKAPVITGAKLSIILVCPENWERLNAGSTFLGAYEGRTHAAGAAPAGVGGPCGCARVPRRGGHPDHTAR